VTSAPSPAQVYFTPRAEYSEDYEDCAKEEQLQEGPLNMKEIGTRRVLQTHRFQMKIFYLNVFSDRLPNIKGQFKK
jgi:hypothetical protein